MIHQLDGLDAVHPAEELERGIAVQLRGQPGQRRGVHDRIGEHDPVDAEGPGQLHLPWRGQRDAPGAGVQLLCPHLRRHRRLPVRGQQYARRRRPVGHHRHVRFHRGAIHRQHGRGHLIQGRRRAQEFANGPTPRRRGEPLVLRPQDAIIERGYGCVVDHGRPPRMCVAYFATHVALHVRWQLFCTRGVSDRKHLRRSM